MNKGFTLIELLIVIAIIGILASVVVVSLGDQVGKTSIAKLEAELAQISSIAGPNFFENGNSYERLCSEVGKTSTGGGTATTTNPFTKTPTLFRIIKSVNDNADYTANCSANISAWAFTANITTRPAANATSPGKDYCIDSVSGLRKKEATSTSSAYTINNNKACATS